MAKTQDRATSPPEVESIFAEITDLKKRAYLEALTKTPSYGEAARLAGISIRTGYNYRHESDTAFQELLHRARMMGVQRAEDEAWSRGIDGWLEPVYHAGKLVGGKRVKSDTMLIFMLKGARPEKYRERYEHSGPGGAPVLAGLAELTGDRIAEHLKGLAVVTPGQLVPPAERPRRRRTTKPKTKRTPKRKGKERTRGTRATG